MTIPAVNPVVGETVRTIGVPVPRFVPVVTVVAVLDRVSPDAILGGMAAVPVYVTDRLEPPTAETVTVPNPGSRPEII